MTTYFTATQALEREAAEKERLMVDPNFIKNANIVTLQPQLSAFIEAIFAKLEKAGFL